MNTTIPRNQTADVLKGLAVIFMIQVHIMEQFASIKTRPGPIILTFANALKGSFILTFFLKSR